MKKLKASPRTEAPQAPTTDQIQALLSSRALKAIRSPLWNTCDDDGDPCIRLAHPTADLPQMFTFPLRDHCDEISQLLSDWMRRAKRIKRSSAKVNSYIEACEDLASAVRFACFPADIHTVPALIRKMQDAGRALGFGEMIRFLGAAKYPPVAQRPAKTPVELSGTSDVLPPIWGKHELVVLRVFANYNRPIVIADLLELTDIGSRSTISSVLKSLAEKRLITKQKKLWVITSYGQAMLAEYKKTVPVRK